MKFIFLVVLCLLLLYVAAAACFYLFQSRLVYYPGRKIEATPQAMGMEYQEVSFEAADGVTLRGWFVPAQKARAVLLFCHGNAGNISHRLESLQIFHSLGLSTFLFDYRGYGLSNGRPSEVGTFQDAEGAWRYLVEKGVAPERIILFGRSMGGAVAAWLAKRHAPMALIVESAFASGVDIAREYYPFFPVGLLTRFRYETVSYVGKVNRPVLVIHSRDDEVIPFSHGKRIFEAAPGPKTFLEISGAHNEGFLTSGRTYVNGLDAFLSGLESDRSAP